VYLFWTPRSTPSSPSSELVRGFEINRDSRVVGRGASTPPKKSAELEVSETSLFHFYVISML
jgi:hypothetical protein